MKLGNDAKKKMKTRESNSLEVGVLTLEGSERQNMGGCRTRFLGSIYHDLSHTAYAPNKALNPIHVPYR
jgi:hypothetical protein